MRRCQLGTSHVAKRTSLTYCVFHIKEYGNAVIQRTMTEPFLCIGQLGILQINFCQYRTGKILKVMTTGKFINTSPAPFHWIIENKEPGNILPPICLTASAYF